MPDTLKLQGPTQRPLLPGSLPGLPLAGHGPLSCHRKVLSSAGPSFQGSPVSNFLFLWSKSLPLSSCPGGATLQSLRTNLPPPWPSPLSAGAPELPDPGPQPPRTGHLLGGSCENPLLAANLLGPALGDTVSRLMKDAGREAGVPQGHREGRTRASIQALTFCRLEACTMKNT